MLRRIIIALVLVLAPAVSIGAARADWRRSIDLNYGTAFTLEQGMVEIGVMTPLSIGVTDELQVAIHPVLLLLGQPYIALRWRVSRYGVATVALNLAGSWSLIRREDEAGAPATEETPGSGFPGTVQLTATLTFRAGRDWLFSVGAGPGIDLLGARPTRGLAEVHASAHWLIDASQLLMLHATGYLDTSDGGRLLRPSLELMYAVALSNVVHLGGGVGFGEFIYEPNTDERKTLHVFPVADIWFRF
ncbi:MAG: hypothetical protein CVU56_02990 [Deltaproteobacteria bacterium HGW-Deltaproteobacteria-14]|jgi:hypothetical protein|nr:MAG: hypothetical protein CVU56_02990 [Deltaproteobacteria bacterium HGW-Deltaproteobacteria-14]